MNGYVIVKFGVREALSDFHLDVSIWGYLWYITFQSMLPKAHLRPLYWEWRKTLFSDLIEDRTNLLHMAILHRYRFNTLIKDERQVFSRQRSPSLER